MLQIVIDTNVLMAALQSQRGASYRVLMLLESGKFDVHLSVPLVLDYDTTLKRFVGDTRHQTVGNVNDILDHICAVARWDKVYYLWRPFLGDPLDDMVVELAVAANCGFIVTYSPANFMGVEQFGVRAVTPQGFLRRIGELP